VSDYASEFKVVSKKKTTKRAFEKTLLTRWGNRLSASRVPETDYRTGKVNHVTLYYLDDKHAGSWCAGQGWLYGWTEAQS
jgi:hypothetical protein